MRTRKLKMWMDQWEGRMTWEDEDEAWRGEERAREGRTQRESRDRREVIGGGGISVEKSRDRREVIG
jgi:hypothetical protein